MQTWLLEMGRLLGQIIMALGVVILVLRNSSLLFGISLLQEVRKDNRTAALFIIGLLLMIGLIVGLFSV